MLPYLINIAQEELTKEVFRDATGLYYSGSYGRQITPKSVWHNGATYVTGFKDQSENNAPVIIKYKDGSIEYNNDIGVIDNPDFTGLNHQHPSIFIFEDYVYIAQVNGHGEDIKIWKSDSPEDISSFSLHHQITGAFGYNHPRILPDNSLLITSTARGSSDWIPYSMILALSDANDFTNWNIIELTEADFNNDGIRHYPSVPYVFGESNWHYIGITLRYETGSVYFAQAMMKTPLSGAESFSKFYSLDESFSKDISTGGLTNTDIENLLITGSLSEKTTYTGPMIPIVIDDTIYNGFYDGEVFKFMKVDGSGNIELFPCDIPLDNTANLSYRVSIDYNGKNLVIMAMVSTGEKNIYACDMNFGNLQFIEQVQYQGEPEGADVALFPWNLDEVEGEYIIGGSTEPDIFPYYKTEDKFEI